MLSKTMLLDLSHMNMGIQAAKAVIHETIPPDVIDFISQGKHDEMYSDTLTYIIEAFEHKRQFVSVEELEESFDSKFCSRFESIRGFHACRITNETSYRDYGLHGLDADRLLKIALERFGGYASEERIRQACAKIEIPTSERGVYFFITLETTKEPSHNHYLKCGCETLGGLAWDLGLANQGILASQGRCCVIECNIPIDQIRLAFLYPIWKELVTFHFKKTAGASQKERFPDWCFSTKGSVTPECIQKFHYFDDSEFEYTLPLH